MQLRDRVTIVTGATRGIGAAIAIEAAKSGSDVAIIGRNQELLEKVKSQITELGRKVLALSIDVSNQAAVDEAVKRVVQEFSKVDCLVNNAGITRDNLLLSMKPD